MILRFTYVEGKIVKDIIIERIVEDYLDALPKFMKFPYQKPGKWVELFVAGRTNTSN